MSSKGGDMGAAPGQGFSNLPASSGPADNSLNPMAMLQAYRNGASMRQVEGMNKPQAMQQQFLPGAMPQYSAAPKAPLPYEVMMQQQAVQQQQATQQAAQNNARPLNSAEWQNMYGNGI